jgi:acetyl esterase/lipase
MVTFSRLVRRNCRPAAGLGKRQGLDARLAPVECGRMPSPAHDAFVARLPPGVATPETPLGPQALAALRAADAAVTVPEILGVRIAPVDAGGVPALLVDAQDPPAARTILFLHGGGFIFLTAAHFAPVLAEIARVTGCRVLGLDYRRAPEHPFPAPLEDALAAYRWLLGQGANPGAVALAGDSAGGGLVLSTLMAIRDQGLPAPAAGLSISPWTDLTTSGASAETVDDPVVSAGGLRMMAETYLAGHDPRDPYASPLFGDLSGLPPLLVQVGTREALLDDSRRLASRAREAGADLTLVELPDVAHMWIYYDPQMPESQQAFAAMGAFFRRHAKQ